MSWIHFMVCACLSLTNALVVLHLVARRTDASEGSVQILTGSWRAGARQTHTLVDICGKRDHVKQNNKTDSNSVLFQTRTNAVLSICRVLVALVAEALEGAQAVDALSVPAHLPLEGAALVNVWWGSKGSLSFAAECDPPDHRGPCPFRISHPCSRCCA